ncbi:MAG TPA: hypothetical protein VMF30_06545, partial [Pirellulales bacterium]|nr:hypothetical protein [Pirellulales bacterium]
SLGLVPGLLTAATRATGDWIERSRYVAWVYGQTPPPAATVAGVSTASFRSGLVGLGCAGLAMLLARVSLSTHARNLAARQPKWNLPKLLNDLHSGYVGDYIVWLMVGLTLLGAALAAAVR